MATHGATWSLALLRWGHLVSLAVAAGGGLWWAVLVREEPEGGDPEAVESFAAREVDRYLRLVGIAGLGMAITSGHLQFFAAQPGRAWVLVLLHGVLLAGLLGVVCSLVASPHWRPKTWRDLRRWAVFILASALLAETAVLDATLQAPTAVVPMILRSVHVVAFGLWLGGAAWNLAVAIPSAQDDPRLAVVVAAAHQLERFRWVVRTVLPTLAVTGILQAIPYVGEGGWSFAGSWIGRLVLLKAGALVALVGIFLLCPLWRACSPVRGMCNLQDLPRPTFAPVRRVDNRGKPCVGFVHVQRALEAMRPGEILEVLSTDPMSWWELPLWAKQNGYELLHQQIWGRYRLIWRIFRFLLRKPPERSEAASEASWGSGARICG